MPRHRIDADAGRAEAAAQLDQVAGVAAADIEDALAGVEVRIGDLVQLIWARGVRTGVEFVEQFPERLAVDLGHVHGASIHNWLPRRRAVRHKSTVHRAAVDQGCPSHTLAQQPS